MVISHYCNGPPLLGACCSCPHQSSGRETLLSFGVALGHMNLIVSFSSLPAPPVFLLHQDIFAQLDQPKEIELLVNLAKNYSYPVNNK